MENLHDTMTSNGSSFNREEETNVIQETLINNLFSANNFLQEKKALQQALQSPLKESLLKYLSSTKYIQEFTLLHSFLVYFFNRFFTPRSNNSSSTSSSNTTSTVHTGYDILVSSLGVLKFPAIVEEDSKCYDQLKG
jgi:ribosomal protein S8